MAKPLRWYLRLLAGLTLISGLAQLGFPGELGAASAWGVAPGWQREIGFWALAMYIVIAQTLRANDAVGWLRLVSWCSSSWPRRTTRQVRSSVTRR